MGSHCSGERADPWPRLPDVADGPSLSNSLPGIETTHTRTHTTDLPLRVRFLRFAQRHIRPAHKPRFCRVFERSVPCRNPKPKNERRIACLIDRPDGSPTETHSPQIGVCEPASCATGGT